MARAKRPTTFSQHFDVPLSVLAAHGAFNPTLAIDSRLFVDPLLLQESAATAIAQQGVAAYASHFEQIVTLLVASRGEEDVAWRAARRLLNFREIPGTCLGYSAASVLGHGFGPELTQRLIRTAHEIVTLGIRDPDLFLVLPLLEDKVGPDLISDMTTNVIIDPLLDFNASVLDDTSVAREAFVIAGRTARLPRNPFIAARTPVVLVPKDVLRDLPIALDIQDVEYAAAQNDAIRDRVNRHIGSIWAAKTRRNKAKLRHTLLASKENFQAFLDAIHSVDRIPYDIEADPLGRVSWAPLAEEMAKRFPLALALADSSPQAAGEVVAVIINRFRVLIEDEGLARNLWSDGRALHERHSQYLFFAVAHAYCEANNLDLSPEIDTGTGKVDFKLSRGIEDRVLVEIKLSTNKKVVPGYTRQLEAYRRAQNAARAFYIVIDLGNLGRRRDQLVTLRNAAAEARQPLAELVFVNGTTPLSASRL